MHLPVMGRLLMRNRSKRKASDSNKLDSHHQIQLDARVGQLDTRRRRLDLPVSIPSGRWRRIEEKSEGEEGRGKIEES